MSVAVKIVQLVIAPNNSEYQGALLGLGSDGVVYRAGSDGQWCVYVPLVFENPQDPA